MTLVKVVRNQKFENVDHWQLFLQLRGGNETLYINRTWKYIAKTEVEIFLTVIVSMLIV